MKCPGPVDRGDGSLGSISSTNDRRQTGEDDCLARGNMSDELLNVAV